MSDPNETETTQASNPAPTKSDAGSEAYASPIKPLLWLILPCVILVLIGSLL